ncbi:MAG: metal-dependent transcriptional regulator [Flavobacteriales bacterium]|nr:metal-dependent transcriptional regulator [Flavobacteriales bacterium]
MTNTQTEENYLKAIYSLSLEETKGVSTNSIAKAMDTKASSVTDMVKKLAQKKLVDHIKYQGVTLTPTGQSIALNIIRKHRLWEYFLVEKLDFPWDEVHEIAEQLEHVSSKALTNRLDQFLGHPKKDPHGDPIPDVHGNVVISKDIRLSDLAKASTGIITGVLDSSKAFLNFLADNNLKLGSKIAVADIYDFDQSMVVLIDEKEKTILSNQVTKNLNINTND